MKIVSGTRTNTARTLWQMTGKAWSFTQTISPSEWSGSSSAGWYYEWSQMTVLDAKNLPKKCGVLGSMSDGVLTSHTVTNVSTFVDVMHSATLTYETSQFMSQWVLKITLTSKTKPTRNYEVSVAGTLTDTIHDSTYYAGEYDSGSCNTKSLTTPRTVWLTISSDVRFYMEWDGDSLFEIWAENDSDYDVEITSADIYFSDAGGYVFTYDLDDLRETIIPARDGVYVFSDQFQGLSDCWADFIVGGTKGIKETKISAGW